MSLEAEHLYCPLSDTLSESKASVRFLRSSSGGPGATFHQVKEASGSALAEQSSFNPDFSFPIRPAGAWIFTSLGPSESVKINIMMMMLMMMMISPPPQWVSTLSNENEDLCIKISTSNIQSNIQQSWLVDWLIEWFINPWGEIHTFQQCTELNVCNKLTSIQLKLELISVLLSVKDRRLYFSIGIWTLFKVFMWYL